MNKLIFIYNELQNPNTIKKLRIPFQFINFGITKGRMYRHYLNNGVFIVPLDTKKRWGNDVVYGSIFLCQDFDFYIRILDAYHACSMSTLLKNHPNDMHHRINVDVRPIYFSSLQNLSQLKYTEGDSITMPTYIGNLNHPKITQRIYTTIPYRVIDGIDAANFTKQFREVNNAQ